MPKLYYPTPDELQGALPLWEGGWGYGDNRGSWFEQWQEPLLRLVNTNEGRDLLCIDPWRTMPFPIIQIRKNLVQYDVGGGQYLTDVRIGAKWGNVIRYRWQEVRKALDRTNLLAIMEHWHPIYDRRGRLLLPIGGAVSTTIYPDADTEETSVDGNAYRTSIQSWSDIRAGVGNGSADDVTGPNQAPVWWKTYSINNILYLMRGFYLFDTSELAGHTISAATMSMEGENNLDEAVMTPSAAIYASTPGSNTAIANSDYQTVGTTPYSSVVTWSNLTVAGSYTDFAFVTAGLDAIDTGGITKTSCCFVADATDTAPSSLPAGTSTWWAAWWADVNGATTSDPKLVITSTAPTFTPRAIIF